MMRVNTASEEPSLNVTDVRGDWAIMGPALITLRIHEDVYSKFAAYNNEYDADVVWQIFNTAIDVFNEQARSKVFELGPDLGPSDHNALPFLADECDARGINYSIIRMNHDLVKQSVQARVQRGCRREMTDVQPLLQFTRFRFEQVELQLATDTDNPNRRATWEDTYFAVGTDPHVCGVSEQVCRHAPRDVLLLILHELGHVAGLAHATLVNAPSGKDLLAPTQYVPYHANPFGLTSQYRDLTYWTRFCVLRRPFGETTGSELYLEEPLSMRPLRYTMQVDGTMLDSEPLLYGDADWLAAGLASSGGLGGPVLARIVGTPGAYGSVLGLIFPPSLWEYYLSGSQLPSRHVMSLRPEMESGPQPAWYGSAPARDSVLLLSNEELPRDEPESPREALVWESLDGWETSGSSGVLEYCTSLDDWLSCASSPSPVSVRTGKRQAIAYDPATQETIVAWANQTRADGVESREIWMSIGLDRQSNFYIMPPDRLGVRTAIAPAVACREYIEGRPYNCRVAYVDQDDKYGHLVVQKFRVVADTVAKRYVIETSGGPEYLFKDALYPQTGLRTSKNVALWALGTDFFLAAVPPLLTQQGNGPVGRLHLFTHNGESAHGHGSWKRATFPDGAPERVVTGPSAVGLPGGGGASLVYSHVTGGYTFTQP